MGSPSRSRKYSSASVLASYSECPKMKICRPLWLETIFTPAIGEEDRMYSLPVARMSAAGISVWREWGIQ